MADMLTVTVGTTDYIFDWIDQHIHVEALVTEVSAGDLKQAIHDAQDDVVGMPFPPIADFYNPVVLTATSSTFLNVVLRDQWRIESLSVSGTLTVGDGNVVNVNNGIDIFAPNVLVNMVNNTSAAGVLVTGGSAVTAQDKLDIAATTWDTKAADHRIAGTYGQEVATKSDLSASASTAIYNAVSATAIIGTVAGGTSADINVRDGTYWHVDEVVGTGLTMEFTFNLALAEERAGVFETYGRYTGAPSNHYLELWAWNVPAAAWELLVEKFIDNTSTDTEHEHEYFERHIDRALSNKVIIRVIHNVTSYSANHHFYMDHVSLSAIDVTGISQQDKDDIEAQIFAHVMENSETFAEQIILNRAAAAGRIIQLADGSYRIRDAADSKDRITGDDAANNGRDISATDGA